MNAIQYAKFFTDNNSRKVKLFKELATLHPDAKVLGESIEAGVIYELEDVEGLEDEFGIKDYVKVTIREGVRIPGYTEGYVEILENDEETQKWLKNQDLFQKVESFEGVIVTVCS